MKRLSWLALSALCLLASCQGEEVAQEEAALCTIEQASPTGVGNPPRGPEEIPTAEALRAALTQRCLDGGCWLRLTGALYQGNFLIPPGTTLEGQVVEGQVPRIVGTDADGAAALRIGATDGCPVTVLRNLSVENRGTGIFATQAGLLYLEAVRVEVSQGAAVALGQMRGVGIRGAQFLTPLSMAELRQVPLELSLSDWPAVGLLGEDNDALYIEDTEILGFAAYGAALRDTPVSWKDSQIHDNQGFGLLFTGEGSRVELENLEVTGTVHSSQWRETTPIGVIAHGGAQVTSQGLSLLDNEGTGFLQDHATATHEGLVAQGNQLVGYWLQFSQGEAAPSLTLRRAELGGNWLAGLVGLQSEGLTLEEVEIRDTQAVPTLEGLAELSEVADGAQLVGMSGSVSLRGVSLTNNLRAGLLLDGGEQDLAANISLREVEITHQAPTERSYGLVTQGLEQEPTQEGVTIDEALLANDLTLQTPLPVTGFSAVPLDPSNTTWLNGATTLDGQGAPIPGMSLGPGGL